MKKLFTIVALLLAMVLLLTACGQKEEEKPAATEAPAAAATAEPASEPTAEPETTQVEEPTAEPMAEPTAEPAAEPEAAPAQADSIEGTWKLTGMKSDNPEDAEFISQMELLLSNGLMENIYTYADGKVTMTAKTNVPGAENQNMTMNGTYTIDGNQLTVIEEGQTTGDPVEFKIDGDTLELITPQMSMTFTRAD